MADSNQKQTPRAFRVIDQAGTHVTLGHKDGNPIHYGPGERITEDLSAEDRKALRDVVEPA